MRTIACVAALLPALAPVSAHAADTVVGEWMTQNRKAVVAIERCGRNVCGRIVRLLPASDVGKTVDERNKEARLRTRPLVGLPILLDHREEDGVWRGKLYDPQAGDTYTSTLSRYPDGTLKVKGCFFFICKTQKWPAAR